MFLIQEVKRLDSTKGWNPTFQMLNLETKKYVEHLTLKAARLPDNRTLNRYRDVLPYDQSRIVLDSVKDYINANLVEVPDINRKYILTQGPLQHTCSHFWQMIWEQKSYAIVMLNRIIEKNTIKCHPYWPLGEEEIVEFGDYRVKNQSEQMASAYVVRELQLENLATGDARTIKQFHYMLWPDFGVPASPNSFLDFLQDVRDSGTMNDDTGPPIVHCSAGIGRSGTFCLVDTALAKVEQDGSPDSIDIRQLLLGLRRYRVGLIQTADQLRFSYIAIIEGIKRLFPGQYEDNIADSEGDKLEKRFSDEELPPPLPPRRVPPQPPTDKPPPLPKEPPTKEIGLNESDLAKEQERQKRLVETLNRGLDDSSEGTEEEVSDLSDSDDNASLEDVQFILDRKESPPRKPLPPLPPLPSEDGETIPPAPTRPLPTVPTPTDDKILLPTYDSEEEEGEPSEKKMRTDIKSVTNPSSSKEPSETEKSMVDQSTQEGRQKEPTGSGKLKVSFSTPPEDNLTKSSEIGSKASENTELRHRQRELKKNKTNELVSSIKKRLKEDEIKTARRRLWTKTAVAFGICAGIFLLIRWFS